MTTFMGGYSVMESIQPSIFLCAYKSLLSTMELRVLCKFVYSRLCSAFYFYVVVFDFVAFVAFNCMFSFQHHCGSRLLTSYSPRYFLAVFCSYVFSSCYSLFVFACCFDFSSFLPLPHIFATMPCLYVWIYVVCMYVL